MRLTIRGDDEAAPDAGYTERVTNALPRAVVGALNSPNLGFCKHPRTRLTRRFRASHWHFARQCVECGCQSGSFVKKEDAIKEGGNQETPQFDEGASDMAFRVEQESLQSARVKQNEKWWAWYKCYLKSDAWCARAALVRERARGLCEGCRLRPCAQVHHLTYEHVGDEFLWELAAICNQCHERAHPDKDLNQKDDA